MASNRHLGRIIALQTLYEQDFRREAGDPNWHDPEILTRNIGRYKEMIDDIDFISSLVEGVLKHAPEIDAKLQLVATEWPIQEIARMDRMVLEMGLYELENEADVPAKVVINESVELAKAFGGDNSSKFINGVLGTLLRQRQEANPETTTDSEAATAKVVAKPPKTSATSKKSKPTKTVGSKKVAKKVSKK